MTRIESSESNVYLHILLSLLMLGLLVRLIAPSNVNGDRVLVTPEPIVTSSSIWEDLNGDGVRDPGEPPISGVRVRVYAYGQDREIGAGWSDEAGRCQLSFLGIPGRYWIRLEAPSGYTFTHSRQGDADPGAILVGPDGTTAPFFAHGRVQPINAGLRRQRRTAALGIGAENGG